MEYRIVYHNSQCYNYARSRKDLIDARMGQIDSLSRPTAGEDEELTLADMVSSGGDMEEDVMKALDTVAMERELWMPFRTIFLRWCVSGTRRGRRWSRLARALA